MKFFGLKLGGGRETIAKRELYLFRQGKVTRAYTNGDAHIEHNGFSFEPHAINRGSHRAGRDLEKETMEIEFSLQSEFAQNIVRSDLEELITVEMFSFEGNEFRRFWSGRLTKSKPHNEGINLQFETSYTKVGRNAVTRKVQAPCPYRVFSDECGLNADHYAVKTTIRTVNGLNLELRNINGYAENYFAIGTIEAPSGVLVTIDQNKADNITLKRRFDGFRKFAISDADLLVLEKKRTDAQTTLSTLNIEDQKNQSLRNAASTLIELNIEDENFETMRDTAAMLLELDFEDFEEMKAAANMLLTQFTIENEENRVARMTAESTISEVTAFLQSISVSLLPGCMRTPTACKAFNNMPNYGGCPFLPTDNPLKKELI